MAPLTEPNAVPPTSLPASRIRVTSRELRRLRSIAADLESGPSQILSARVLILAARGLTDEAIALQLEVPGSLVSSTLRRFARSRFSIFEHCWLPVNDPGAARIVQQPIRVELTGAERRSLQQIARAHTSEQRMALRARIVLEAGLGLNNCQIADQLGIDVKTVRKWRGRYCLSGMEGLYDAYRSGRPFRFDSGVRNELFTAVVGEPPEPFATWTLDLLAKHLVDHSLGGSISIETISYWLRTADIKPHRVRGWLYSKDPNFREKRDRIAALYRNPPADGELLSVDEKTSIPARERIRNDGQLGPGRLKKHEWEYVRHGTVHLLASFNVRTGQVIAEIPSGKNDSEAFIGFLKRLMLRHPRRKLYLILDNGTTHCSKKTKAFFAKHPRIIPVFTPTHASWLNQIEIWFSVMSRQALRKVSFTSRQKLIERLEAYVSTHNLELAVPYEWSSKDKPLVGVTARERRRSRNTAREFRKADHC